MVGLKYNGMSTELSLFEAKGRENIKKELYDKAVNEQLPVVNTLLGKNVYDRILCYSVYDTSLNNVKKQLRKKNRLKIILACGNNPDKNSLDFIPAKGMSSGFIRREIEHLIEDIGEGKKSSNFKHRFGKIVEKTENGRHLVEIHYTDCHYVTISIGSGDDIKIIENHIASDGAVGKDSVSGIKRINKVKPV